MENKCYVYGHYTKDTDEIFYIGKGTGKRAWVKYGRSIYWKNKVNKDGLVVKILEENLTDERAYTRERELIAEVGIENLVNFLEGGYGMTSADALRLWQDPEFRKKMEKVYQDPEWRRKNAEKNKRLAQDPEWRRKNAEAAKRRSQDPEYRRKQSEALKRYHANKKKELENQKADEFFSF